MHQSRLILLIVLIIVIILIIVCVSRDCKKHRSTSKRRKKVSCPEDSCEKHHESECEDAPICDQECSELSECPGRFCQVECDNSGEGCIDLPYEAIYDDLFSDMSQAIYHQYLWQEYFSTANKLLETQKEFSIPVSKVVKGTEANQDAPVYGYKKLSSGRSLLIKDGGKEKTYPDSLKSIKVKYNGANPEEHLDTGLIYSRVKPFVEHHISYFLERGYTIPPPDVPNKFKELFVWTLGAGTASLTNLNGAISMRFIFKEGIDCPDFLDLTATATPIVGVIENYEPNPLARKNGYRYPTRIPVTTDFCGTFQNKYGNEPIAYWDMECSTITVHVPEREGDYLISQTTIETGNSDLDYTEEDYLRYFDGSFKILKREKKVKPAAFPSNGHSSVSEEDREDSQLIPTLPKYCQVLAQVSSSTFWESRHVLNGNEEILPNEFPMRLPILQALGVSNDPRDYYIGIVLPLLNSGSPSLDVNCVPFPLLNAYVFDEDPINIPGGDNSNTRLMEKYSIPSSTTLWENSEWTELIFKLPKEVFEGKYCPEEIAKIPRLKEITTSEAFAQIAGHEFVHLMQAAAGSIYILPVESMATGIELDYKLNEGAFGAFRSPTIPQRSVLLMSRGRFSPMQPDNGGFTTTYGMGVFWKYLAEQFDANYQIPRRIMDIITSETAGPLLESLDHPTLGIVPIINYTGNNSALEQALKELYDMKYADVWFNFMVACTMYRNNKAIPKQYRHQYPYWIWSEKYVDFAKIANADFRTPQWWDKLDENQIIDANDAPPYTGQTFLRTLDANFSGSCKNYYGFSFNISHSTNSLTVNIDQGVWKIMVFQFTPGPHGCVDKCQGSWTQDGPFEMKVGQKRTFQTGSSKYTSRGNIRLVCANVTPLTGDGKQLADYYQPEPDTGAINITLN